MRKVYYPVAKLGEMQPGEGRRVKVGDSDDCALFCISPTEYYATGALCPHANEPLDQGNLEGFELICRRHYLCFDIRNGNCTNAGGFAVQTFEVRVEGESIQIGVWED